MRKQYIVNWKFQFRYSFLGIIPLFILGLLLVGIIFHISNTFMAIHKNQLKMQIFYLENIEQHLKEAPLQAGRLNYLVYSIENIKSLSQELIEIGVFKWKEFMWSISLLTGIFIIGIFCFGILYSHRVAGPLFRIKRILGEMSQNMNIPIYVRATDEFQDFFSVLERMRKEIAERQRRREEIITQLDEKIQRLSEKGILDEPLSEELKRYIIDLKKAI